MLSSPLQEEGFFIATRVLRETLGSESIANALCVCCKSGSVVFSLLVLHLLQVEVLPVVLQFPRAFQWRELLPIRLL